MAGRGPRPHHVPHQTALLEDRRETEHNADEDLQAAIGMDERL